MIKLIAADVDGTLVEEGTRRINPEYFDVIRALRKKGIVFVAASGRNAVSISSLFAPVKDEIGMISCSGAVFWRFGVPHVISAIDYADVVRLEEEVAGIPDSGFMADTPERTIMQPGQDVLYHFLSEGYGCDVHLTKNGRFPEEETYVKLAIYHPDRIEEMTEEIRRRWSPKLHLCYAGGVWLDVIRKECNKGNALELIQKDLGILPEETMAFGDNGNDIEMLRMAGISCAVSGAREEVKAASSRVIGSWQEDSVLTEMKKLL